mmetsp:Transcript_39977/g.61181  ORF Transcript_39977/g.61181 Transcript_39977/m.61181 type:complete len:142 (-) Transcript_39977:60-485(-)
MVQSVGVIIAALIIYFRPDWQIADPICTFLFSILVLFTTVPVFVDSMKIFMEGSPSEFDVDQLYNEIQEIKYIEELHDFHCWTLGGGTYVMTCHIRSDYPQKAIAAVNLVCRKKAYGVYHTTIQVERSRPDAHAISCDFLS